MCHGPAQGHEANPQDAHAARLYSTAFTHLGDFYLSRGASGDAERALAQFEESLRMDQQLYEANPNSAQAGARRQCVAEQAR